MIQQMKVGKIMLTEKEIKNKVEELGAAINADYGD